MPSVDALMVVEGLEPIEEEARNGTGNTQHFMMSINFTARTFMAQYNINDQLVRCMAQMLLVMGHF